MVCLRSVYKIVTLLRLYSNEPLHTKKHSVDQWIRTDNVGESAVHVSYSHVCRLAHAILSQHVLQEWLRQ